MGVWVVDEGSHSWRVEHHGHRPGARNVRLNEKVSAPCLCTEGSAGSSNGETGLEARTWRGRDTRRGPHIQPPIKGVKIGRHVYSKQHATGFGSNSDVEARTDFQCCPQGVNPLAQEFCQ